MKNIRVISVALAVFMLSFGCKTKSPTINVRHVRNLDAGHSLQGFYYALPRTVVIVDFTITKTEEIPGPFASYASKHLSIEDVIKSYGVFYEITDVKINTYAEPDPSEFYFVEYNAKQHQEEPLSLYFSEAGLISSVNTPFDAHEFLKSIPEEKEHGYFGSEATFNHFYDYRLQERIDTILEQVRQDTITFERKTLRRTWVEKTSEVRAKEVAEYIMNIRSKKFDLISGFAEITYSKEALQYMVNQLQKQENNYLELFTGITTESTLTYRFYHLPQKNQADKPETLFYFSEFKGVVDEYEPTADAITLEVRRSETTRQMGVFTMNPTGGKSVDRGFYYRIPEHGHINIRKNDAPLADARHLISQYGIITSLPPDNFEIEFFPNTGSVKSVRKVPAE